MKRDNCDNEYEIAEESMDSVRLFVKGFNNKIRIGKCVPGSAVCNIELFGNNNFISIADGWHCRDRILIIWGINEIHLGAISNSSLIIGRNFHVINTAFSLAQSNSRIEIGDDNMYANNIIFHGSDTHPVFDLKSGKMINYSKSIEIGNRVWMGHEVKILKNTRICDDSIVGMAAVVTRKFDQPNVVIAGNPAQIVKKGIYWKWNGGMQYVNNNWNE